MNQKPLSRKSVFRRRSERPFHTLKGIPSVSIKPTSTGSSAAFSSTTNAILKKRDNPPFGDRAPIGLYGGESSNVHRSHLIGHGLAASGVHAGRLTDWSVEDVHVVGNGSSGWMSRTLFPGGSNTPICQTMAQRRTPDSDQVSRVVSFHLPPGSALRARQVSVAPLCGLRAGGWAAPGSCAKSTFDYTTFL